MSASEELQKLSEQLIRCNKCGFCLAGCPIYKATGIEWTVARQAPFAWQTGLELVAHRQERKLVGGLAQAADEHGHDAPEDLVGQVLV